MFNWFRLSCQEFFYYILLDYDILQNYKTKVINSQGFFRYLEEKISYIYIFFNKFEKL
uniref:Uncharacterized protein n=1 Tax=Lepeophtheirus salmonis TaxID=72036 RepID=A0A0K2T256_LEPSM